MNFDTMVFMIFLIFTGAAVLATFVLYTRQSLLVAYMLLGVILGPWGLGIIKDTEMVKQVGDIGIIFLLFLLGLYLQPQNLLHMFRKATLVALVSSLIFAGLGFAVTYIYGLSLTDSLVVGAAVMFSSTIIGLKLLPTTILHHQHTGEVMISVLLMQDFIAIFVMLLLNGASTGFSWMDLGVIFVSLPGLVVGAFLFEKFVLIKLLAKFDRVQEYIFLLSIGWCLGLAELAAVIGLSEDIGAFIAGVVLAASPIALYIAESLKPLRDFFLVMFFFSVGATFNLSYVHQLLIPAMVLAILILVLKPLVFKVLLRYTGETKQVSWEVAARLGQASEFSLLIAGMAVSSHLISDLANNLIQATTILTFIVSSYFIVMRYPTPMALSDKMRRD